MADLNFSGSFLEKINTMVKDIIASGKGNDLLNELVTYSKFYSSSFHKLNKYTNRIEYNLDTISFVMASCSTVRNDEAFLHKVYITFNELSTTPLHLFAFEYYRKYLIRLEMENAAHSAPASTSTSSPQAVSSPSVDKTRKLGRGQKKFLSRWYSQNDELDRLRLMTQFKHGYSWSNKDLLKLIHMKPKNEGTFLK